jgi:hypothetical protein
MYVNFLGGSALLHILAAHPKVVAALGVAATIATLCAPLAPRSVAAIASHAASLETAAGPASPLSTARAEELRKFVYADDAAIQEAVTRALDACGAPCNDLSVSLVLNDPALLEKALFVAALDREAHAQGLPGNAEIARRLAQR